MASAVDNIVFLIVFGSDWSFLSTVVLLVPTHASLCSWHSLHGSVLDSLHQLQHWQRSPVRPECGSHWRRLSRHPPDLHQPPWPPGRPADSPARPGSWEAGQHLLPARLWWSAGQKHSTLPAVSVAGHRRELLCDSSWFEWKSGEGMAEPTGTGIKNKKKWWIIYKLNPLFCMLCWNNSMHTVRWFHCILSQANHQCQHSLQSSVAVLPLQSQSYKTLQPLCSGLSPTLTRIWWPF